MNQLQFENGNFSKGFNIFSKHCSSHVVKAKLESMVQQKIDMLKSPDDQTSKGKVGSGNDKESEIFTEKENGSIGSQPSEVPPSSTGESEAEARSPVTPASSWRPIPSPRKTPAPSTPKKPGPPTKEIIIVQTSVPMEETKDPTPKVASAMSESQRAMREREPIDLGKLKPRKLLTSEQVAGSVFKIGTFENSRTDYSDVTKPL